MDKKKLIVITIMAVVLLACVAGAVYFAVGPHHDPEVPQTTAGSLPEEPGPSADLSGPEETSVDTQPATDPTQRRRVEVSVVRADGSVARGAAVIATDRDGWQEYGVTDESGVAALVLSEGKHSLRILLDGQHEVVALEVGGAPVRTQVRLKDDRSLYILMEATGSRSGDLEALADISLLTEAIRARYPDAVYIRPEERHEIAFRDGDALLSVEVQVENYTADDRYFAGGVVAGFRGYQQTITVWDLDEAGKEIDIEYIDGNMCSVQVRNEYDYEYRSGVAYITGSGYVIQKDYHLSKYSSWADPLGYGYTEERVPGTSSEQRIDASGTGMRMDVFLSDTNAARYRDYAAYVEKLFPYVDLWMSGDWNGRIEALASLK